MDTSIVDAIALVSCAVAEDDDRLDALIAEALAGPDAPAVVAHLALFGAARLAGEANLAGLDTEELLENLIRIQVEALTQEEN